MAKTKKNKPLLFCIIITCFVIHFSGQTTKLELLTGNKKEKYVFRDSMSASKFIENLIIQLILDGYPELHSKIIKISSNELLCKIEKNKKYKHIFIHEENGNMRHGQKSHRHPEKYVLVLLEKMNKEGYCFSSVSIHQIEKKNDSVFFTLHVLKGPKVFFDSVLNKGKASVKLKVFSRISGIRNGYVFSDKTLNEASKRINATGFMVISAPPVIRYQQGKMKVWMYADPLSGSRFDGIAGLQPDPTSNKAVLTGNIQIHLKNSLLHHAEDLKMEWRRVKAQTQEIQLSGKLPYVFGTGMGTEGKFNLFRQDSSVLDVQWEGGLHFFLSGMNSVRIYSSQRNNSGKSNAVPGFLSGESKTTMGGIGLNIEKTNFPLNPTRGMIIQINAATGKRTIKTKISVQENENVQTNHYHESKGLFQFFIPVSQRQCIMTGIRWMGASTSSPLLPSELFRVGGLQTWRGFDENQFLASAYAIHTLEYRFVFSTLSHLSVFTDAGWFERLQVNSYKSSFAFGYGIGTQLETKGGIIRLAYALGNLSGQTPDFRAGKIHVGFVSVFK
ncbi:MAG: outer membrane protein assembly factor [Bacteroidia bacterium]|nr:outer membrane protein assembly factor [Bacteroidia bacterium]